MIKVWQMNEVIGIRVHFIMQDLSMLDLVKVAIVGIMMMILLIGIEVNKRKTFKVLRLHFYNWY